MKFIAFLASALLGTFLFTANAGAVTAASPDIVQVTAILEFPAGASSFSYTPILTVPTNKRLVVQTISYWRAFPAQGSISNVFLQTNIFGVSAYIPGPTITADGSSYPNAAASTTFYAGAGAVVNVGAYRTGNVANAENMYVTLSGYYVLRD